MRMIGKGLLITVLILLSFNTFAQITPMSINQTCGFPDGSLAVKAAYGTEQVRFIVSTNHQVLVDLPPHTPVQTVVSESFCANHYCKKQCGKDSECRQLCEGQECREQIVLQFQLQQQPTLSQENTVIAVNCDNMERIL